VTVTLQRGEATVIIRGVPGEVCRNCGEYFLSEGVTGEVLARADRAIENGAEVEILRYAA
jgi:YgiT-type zinc finger domain-containing protein